MELQYNLTRRDFNVLYLETLQFSLISPDNQYINFAIFWEVSMKKIELNWWCFDVKIFLSLRVSAGDKPKEGHKELPVSCRLQYQLYQLSIAISKNWQKVISCTARVLLGVKYKLGFGLWRSPNQFFRAAPSTSAINVTIVIISSYDYDVTNSLLWLRMPWNCFMLHSMKKIELNWIDDLNVELLQGGDVSKSFVRLIVLKAT